jgi:uncharacterized protein (TIGR03083 family)
MTTTREAVMPDAWSIIHAERAALADDLGTLAEERWTTPSLCSGWTVHQLLGHMIATAKMTPPRFFAGLAKAGFRFDAMTARDADRETAQGPIATLAEFRRVQSWTKKPPGPIDAMVGEAVIHPADIRRPLGIDHSPPPEVVVRALEFYKGSNLIVGAKKRIAGLSLRADDVAWSTGTGPEVTVPALSLLLVMTGRAAALPDLSGPGVSTLTSRMA